MNTVLPTVALISNAIKYSPEGDEVCIRVQHTPQEVLVSVAGGLGLYISQGIVEAHGGRIWVEREAGQGTTFSVALLLFSAAPGAVANLIKR